MKIGFITNYFFPEKGAAAIRNHYFIKNWSKNQNDQIVLITEKDNTKTELNYNDNVVIKRIAYKTLGNKNKFIFRLLSEMLFSFLVFIKLLFLKIDLYYVTSPSFLLILPVFLISKFKKKKYILDVRDHYPDVLIKLGYVSESGIIAKSLFYLERAFYNNSAFVTTVTIGLKEEIEKRTSKQVFLMRNGVDKSIFFKKNIPKTKFTIIIHGNLGKLINVDLLINYAEYLKKNKIKGIQIVVIGEGSKTRCLESSIKKKSLNDQLKYIGYIDYEQIPEYLNRANIGIVPLVNNRLSQSIFPVKAYEYMGCGLPIIVSPYSEAGKFVEQNKIGFQFGGKSIRELNSIIMKLYSDNKLYQRCCEKSQRYGSEFDRNKIAEDLYQLIKKQLSKE